MSRQLGDAQSESKSLER